MRITPKLVLAFVLVTLAPLGAVAALSYGSAEETLRNQVLDQLQSTASTSEARVESILEHNLERLILVTSRTQLRESLARYLDNPHPANLNPITATVVDASKANPSFRNITVLDTSGRVVVSSDRARNGTVETNRSYFPTGLEGNRVDLLRLDANGSLNAYLSGPLYLDDRLLGMIVIDASMTELVAVVMDYTGLRTTGETLLVARNGTGTLIFLAPTRFWPDAALQPFPRSQGFDTAEEAIEGREDVFEDPSDYRGEPVLAATRWIESTNWGLVVKIDRAEAFAPIARLGTALLWSLGGALVLAVLISTYVAQSFTRPLRHLTRSARQVAQGEEQRVSVPRGGTREVAELVQSFDAMTQGLIESKVTLEARVAERTAELERSNAELEQFAYVASHDLQEPLRMIAGFVQLLEEEYSEKLDDEGREYIRYATDGAQRMQLLIRDLLDFSRAGSRGLKVEDVSANDLVDRAVDNLQLAVEEHQATVTRDSLPTLRGDPALLTQVFQNLIGNGIKFQSEAPPRVHVGHHERSDEWVMYVRDNGIGIDPREHEKIFGLFQRLHGHQTPGTGIGLALARRIVERHGGRIWVDSRPGVGSTLSFTIPRGGPPLPADDGLSS